MADLSIINQVSHNLLAWTIGIFILLVLNGPGNLPMISMNYNNVPAVLPGSEEEAKSVKEMAQAIWG